MNYECSLVSELVENGIGVMIEVLYWLKQDGPQ